MATFTDKSFDDRRRAHGRGRAALPVLLLLALAALPQLAAAQTGERAELRRVVEQRYEVLPIRDGVLLKPRAERLGVRSIEVAGDTLAVNGERLSAEVLRAWLAEEAEPILRLHRLPAGERRALFGLPADAGAAAAPGAPAEALPEAVPPGESTEIPEGEEPLAGIPPIPPVPAPPAPPDFDDLPHRRSGSRVSITQSVVVEEGEVASEAVAVAGSVRVDGEVRGDVVAVGGSATINGRVGGEVTAVGGGVRLGPEAEVMRNVTSVGGRVERAEGAQVHGEVNEVSLWSVGGRRHWRRGWDFDPDFDARDDGEVGEFVGSIVWIVFLALIGAVALLLARGPIERIERQVGTDAWRSAAVGFLVQLLILPITLVVSIVLLVSIIGWPLFLLYPFIALGLLIASFLGFVAVALRLGRWLEGRFGRAFVSSYFAVLAGVVLIQLWWIIGRLLSIADGFLGPIAGFTMLLGFLAQYLAWTTGLGAALLAWSESRRERRWVAPPPPPPAPEPGPEHNPDYGTSPGSAASPAAEPAWPEGEPGR